jgi:hypothetical protein
MTSRSARIRLSLAAVSAALLIFVYATFDRSGADCGDAVDPGGGDSFHCNALADVYMAVGALAAVVLLLVAAWALVAWTRRRAWNSRR